MKLRKVFTFYFLLFVFSSIFAWCKKSVPFMKKFWGFLLVIVLMTSCGEYQSLLKSNDYNLVYKKAIEYYNKGDYPIYSSSLSRLIRKVHLLKNVFIWWDFAIIKLPRNHVWISRLPKKLSGNSSFIWVVIRIVCEKIR